LVDWGDVRHCTIFRLSTSDDYGHKRTYVHSFA
jgi:hypothetical protein